MTFCGTSNPFNFTGNSFVTSFYQTADCSNEVVVARAYKNDYCATPNTGGSTLYKWPYQKFYESETCSGNPISSVDVSNICLATDDDAIQEVPIYYNTYTGYSYVGSSSSASLSVRFSTIFISCISFAFIRSVFCYEN